MTGSRNKNPEQRRPTCMALFFTAEREGHHCDLPAGHATRHARGTISEPERQPVLGSGMSVSRYCVECERLTSELDRLKQAWDEREQWAHEWRERAEAAEAELGEERSLLMNVERYRDGYQEGSRRLEAERDEWRAYAGRLEGSIVGLEAERDAETRRADDNDDARKKAVAERDRYTDATPELREPEMGK